MPSKYKYIVDCYSKGSRVRLHKMLDLCTSLHDFVYGIEISQNGEKVTRCCIPACEVDCFSIRLNRNSHQRQVPNGILLAFEKKMGSLNFRQSFHNFDEFFEYVAANCGLKNGHCLLVYDFCLRKGLHMSPQIEPIEYVYLFQGAKEGAENVIGKLNNYKLPIKLLQDALDTNLSSIEIEDLLCVCKEHLKYIGPITAKKRQALFKKHNVLLLNVNK